MFRAYPGRLVLPFCLGCSRQVDQCLGPSENHKHISRILLVRFAEFLARPLGISNPKVNHRSKQVNLAFAVSVLGTSGIQLFQRFPS
jgi:hypothetical protein